MLCSEVCKHGDGWHTGTSGCEIRFITHTVYYSPKEEGWAFFGVKCVRGGGGFELLL
jgi:hypothetical protein